MFQALLAFSGAVLCSGLAVYVIRQAPSALAHRAFAAGMWALALMDVFAGLGAHATLPLEVICWERLRMVAAALLPGL